MATRPLGTGYDPNSGWPPDDSTNIGWGDVDLTDYGNFGRGGFAGNPKITSPTTGIPPGTSISGPGGNASGLNDSLTARPATPDEMASARGPTMTSGPQNLRPGMSPAVRTGPGPYTDATANPGAGMWSRVRGLFPGILAGAGPAAVPALAAGGAAAGAWAEPRTPRVDPRISAAGTGGFDVEQPLGGASASAPAPIDPYGLTRANAPIDPYGLTRTPIGSPAPAVPPVRPAAAGPAAAQQQPNLGNYASIYQPNIARTGNVRGGRSGDDNAPMMGALDLSRLFQRPQQ